MPDLPHLRRLLLSGLLVTAATGLIGGCKEETKPENLVEEPNGLIPELPTELTMDRAAVLAAVAAAASDYSAGLDDSQSQSALDGKRFEFRIPFGCASDDSVLDKSLKLVVRPDGKAYEASATPDIALADVEEFRPVVDAPSDAAAPDHTATINQATATIPVIEAAEGFWITRPWMLNASCPAAPLPKADAPDIDDATKKSIVADKPADQSAAAPSPTVGIVQYYGENDSRVGARNGKPLTKIETITGLKPAPTTGAVMVLQGRLRHWPDGKVILCKGEGRTSRPQCLVSATIDRVAFERADNRTVIAEWTR